MTIEEAIAWLEEHGREVGQSSLPQAKLIQQAYQLFYARQESGAAGILIAAIEDYMAAKEPPEFPYGEFDDGKHWRGE